MLPDWVWSDDDRRFMAMALAEARAAGERGEVPVGAVVVDAAGTVLARAGNCRQGDGDPTGHAELVVLRAAGRRRGDWRLEGCTLYATLEPCPMCAAACRQARLDLVVWGAPDPLGGACGTVLDLAEDPRLAMPPLAQRGGLDAAVSRALLESFFARRRDPS